MCIHQCIFFLKICPKENTLHIQLPMHWHAFSAMTTGQMSAERAVNESSGASKATMPEGPQKTVVVLGLPRSGTTALWQILVELLHPKTGHCALSKRSDSEGEQMNTEATLESQETGTWRLGCVLKTHVFHAQYNDASNFILFYCVRHPFDVFASWVRISGCPLDKDGHISSQAASIVQNVKKHLDEAAHIQTLQHCHLVQYETWQDNWSTLFARLEEILGLSISRERREFIQQLCGREANLVRLEQLGAFDRIDKRTLIHGGHVSKVTTDWKLLPQHVQQHLSTCLALEMKQLGYERSMCDIESHAEVDSYFYHEAANEMLSTYRVFQYDPAQPNRVIDGCGYYFRQCGRDLNAAPARFAVFDCSEAIAINYARMDFLKCLNIAWRGARVLETGAGPRGQITSWLEKAGAQLTVFDARKENVEEHARRHPHRQKSLCVIDFDQPRSLAVLPQQQFDVAVCVGTLYHLSQPWYALDELKRVAPILVLETRVSATGEWNFTTENTTSPNQSFAGTGCRPGIQFLREELRQRYASVVEPCKQPDHQDFVVPTNIRRCFVCRSSPA